MLQKHNSQGSGTTNVTYFISNAENYVLTGILHLLVLPIPNFSPTLISGQLHKT
jgi:hypothetical protein